MIRIAHIGDDHFDETSRFAECVNVHGYVAREIERRSVDLSICAGDLFERRSTIRERIAAAEWLTAMTDVAPLVLVRGNHDATTADGTDLEVFRKLRTRFPLIIEDRARAHSFETPSGWIHVGAVAWPEEATAKAALSRMGGPLSVEGGHVALGELLRNVLRGIGDELAESARQRPGPRILAMHALVSGCVTSTGQPLIGDCLNVGLEDIALARADYVALAHIHKHQHFVANGAPVVYCGSPYRTAFGEVETKGFVVAEFDASGVHWELVPTPCAGMELFEAAWTGAELTITSKAFPRPDRVRGAECRLRVIVDADQRDAARSAIGELRDRMLADGALRVKVEEQIRPMVRARAPEIAKATTLEGQLAALWAAKRPELGDERRARLISKLGEVRNA